MTTSRAFTPAIATISCSRSLWAPPWGPHGNDSRPVSPHWPTHETRPSAPGTHAARPSHARRHADHDGTCARCRPYADVPQGILRPSLFRAHAAGDARAVGVERRRARNVRGVRVATQ